MIQDILAQALRDDGSVLFAYLFGSSARGTTGPLSDVDVAVYLDEKADLFECRLRLMRVLSRVLKTERVDVIVLNEAPMLLGYAVIRDGVVIKEHREARIPFETFIMRHYLDTAYLREVQLRSQKRQIERGTYFG